ncbi:uncharacterized protein LOC131613755 [Vicia villosa]|uniref:uncharacterized protein LOC131613755 n=1 Tax=Vicia villosa TaxID=3911 RepID=UPI00273B46C0|nr:uncharacterized protein LOC131613755 [Vicia villosa]
MKILSWNCRGLSSPRAIPNLRKLAHTHQPDIIFLSETLTKTCKLESIRVGLKFTACFVIDVDGRSGGLAVLWKNSNKCSVQNFTHNFINIHVKDDNKGEWRLTCYYGYPERNRRRQAWDMLREISSMSSLPWCIIGDFNDMLSQQDKHGIHPHPNWLCNGFRDTVSDYNLVDIPLEGHQYTWVMSRGTDRMVEERLDRALANTSWLELSPSAKLVNLITTHSDHSPILLSCDPALQYRRHHAFRFENCWLEEEDIEDVVRHGWQQERACDVTHQISNYAKDLEKWNNRNRRRRKEEIDSHK